MPKTTQRRNPQTPLVLTGTVSKLKHKLSRCGSDYLGNTHTHTFTQIEG